jgi:hypothetical protein
MTVSGIDLILLILKSIVALFIYFLPSIIASVRNSVNSPQLLLANIKYNHYL